MESNNKSIIDNRELVQWGGIINEFLWICAGANRKILRQCPTDYAKYAGIGGTIFFTALMAMLSGGYALYFVFNSVPKAIAFGVFWGMLIFNLDRFIVNTMYSDGKVTISWQEFYSGLPRIIMAVFLGIVISTPLEMKIFEDRINSQLVQDNIERTNRSRAKANEGNASLLNRRDALEKEQKEIRNRLAKANQELKEEGEGAALSGKAGHGPIYEDKKANRDAIQDELVNWNSAHESELEDVKKQIQINSQNASDDIKKGNKENGFCVRYEAFSNIKSDNVALNIHRVRVMSDKRISDLNDEINTEVLISTQKNKERLEAEVLANKELMEKIAKTQAELLNTAIEKWREEELAKINENPSAYIKTNNAS